MSHRLNGCASIDVAPAPRRASAHEHARRTTRVLSLSAERERPYSDTSSLTVRNTLSQHGHPCVIYGVGGGSPQVTRAHERRAPSPPARPPATRERKTCRCTPPINKARPSAAQAAAAGSGGPAAVVRARRACACSPGGARVQGCVPGSVSARVRYYRTRSRVQEHARRAAPVLSVRADRAPRLTCRDTGAG